MVAVTFVSTTGRDSRTVHAAPGMTLLQLAHREGIDIEGACGGQMACSTCHVIVRAADYERLSTPGEEEEDLLDLAPGVTMTSRLACQIVLTEQLEGLTVRLPGTTHDMRG